MPPLALPDQSGPAPLYVAAARLLMREIMAGRLADGARLPPEREMASEMGIAVGTLRRALADLAEKGLIERVQGSGNYVRAGVEVSGIYAFFRLEKLDGGGVPSAELLDLSYLPKPPEAPAFGPHSHAQRLCRLRLLDDVPAALEEIWLDATAVPDLRADQLDAPLYHTLRARFGLWIASAEDRVGLARAPDWAPAAFAPAIGTLCPHVQRVGRAQTGEAVEYSRTWIDASRAVYVQRLT